MATTTSRPQIKAKRVLPPRHPQTTSSSVQIALRASPLLQPPPRLQHRVWFRGCLCTEYLGNNGFTRPKPEYDRPTSTGEKITQLQEALRCLDASFARAEQGEWEHSRFHYCTPGCPWFEHRGVHICCIGQRAHLCTSDGCDLQELNDGIYACALTGKEHGAAVRDEWMAYTKYNPNAETIKQPIQHVRATTEQRIQDVLDTPLNHLDLALLSVGKPLPSLFPLIQAAKESVSVAVTHPAVLRQLETTDEERFDRIRYLAPKVFAGCNTALIDEIHTQWLRVISTEAWQSTLGQYTLDHHIAAVLFSMRSGIYTDEGRLLPSIGFEANLNWSLLERKLDMNPNLAKDALGTTLKQRLTTSIRELNDFLNAWLAEGGQTTTLVKKVHLPLYKLG